MSAGQGQVVARAQAPSFCADAGVAIEAAHDNCQRGKWERTCACVGDVLGVERTLAEGHGGPKGSPPSSVWMGWPHLQFRPRCGLRCPW